MKKSDAIQFGKYWIGGTVYFWTGYGIFALCYSGLGWNWFWAKVAGDVVGLSANYMIQRYWAFNDPSLKGKNIQISAKYIATMAISLTIDYLIVGWLKHIGVSPYIGLFVAAAFFTIWNYLWYKFWVFKSKK